MSTQKGFERLSIRIPDEMHKRLTRRIANSGNETASNIVRDALDQYLSVNNTVSDASLQEIGSNISNLQTSIDVLSEAVSTNELVNALVGLIDHAILPMMAQDRKSPIIAIQNRLKDSVK